MRRPTLLYGLARTAVGDGARAGPLTVRAQTCRASAQHRTNLPEVRRLDVRRGRRTSTSHDLEQSISTQAVDVPKPRSSSRSAWSATRRRSRTSTTSTRPSCGATSCAFGCTTGSAAIARPRSTRPSTRTGAKQGRRSRSRCTRTSRRSSARSRSIVRLDADQRHARGAGSRCCTPNDPLDLVALDSMRVLFQNELWDRGLRRRCRRHDGRRRHGDAARRRRGSRSSPNRARRSARSRSPATQRVDQDDDSQHDHVQDRAICIASPTIAREPAQSLRVEPVPARARSTCRRSPTA